ncbi:BON domain-containing protein [Polynucleobacter arcticus]|uniref:Transporter n=1 Tax=Polynucleobacter arcticus TaxID=1743165 RepID=A0A6M9PKS7_9BURK|nr:BON domain-containing protein [Polynucleobacter arcticus]QKM59898.1 transporter [Polynucleobacter arcticus]
MKIDTSFKAVFASMMIVSGLAACDKPGPAETAGKKIDQTTESVSAAVSNSADKASTTIAAQGKEAGQAMSDTEITAKIKAILLNEPGLDSLKVTVDTVKGIVTLSGSVASQDKADKVIKLSKSVDGVKSVNSKLMISK